MHLKNLVSAVHVSLFVPICVTGLMLCVSSELQAQSEQEPVSEEPREALAPEVRARELFDDAHSALAEGRLGDAQWALAESLRLLPRPPTALNLAQVHRNMGELLAAERLIGRLNAGEFGAPDERLRVDADALARAVSSEIVDIVVTVIGVDHAELSIDGALTLRVVGGNAQRLRVDPGPHDVVALSDGERRSHRIVAQRGVSEPLTFDFRMRRVRAESQPEESPEPNVNPVVDVTPPDSDSGGGGVWRSPVFWTVVGVLLAGGAATAIIVTTRGSTSPREDPSGVFPVIQALSW